MTRVIVIGAGAVGMCSALFLQKLGCEVTVVDRLPPGEACSFGNAGSLSWSSCVPIATPGMLAKVPGWLLRSDGPLTIRWRHLHTLMPWLWRFIRAGNEAQLEKSVPALASLHRPSLDLHRELANEAGSANLIHGCDFMHVYSSEKSFADSSYGHLMRNRHGGAGTQVLDGPAIRELEPQISNRYVKALRILDQGYTANPSQLVKSYAALLCANGGQVVQDEVTGFEVSANRVTSIKTTSQTLTADEVVIAGGAWSAKLCAMLGVKVPLESERGYHVTVADSGVSLQRTIMETDGMFVATPMDMGVRFAGTVELANVDVEPNYERADNILKQAKRMFPELKTESVSRWMGRRPSLPDGLPVIGPSPRQENVHFAFGHAHTGMIGSPQSGRLVAGMVCKQPLNMDAEPFRVERFGA